LQVIIKRLWSFRFLLSAPPRIIVTIYHYLYLTQKKLTDLDTKEAAFKQIFEANSKKIYHLCYGYTGDDDAANDLLQETFLKVWQNLDKFRNQAQISTWIYRIAVNTDS